jgi:protein Mpv17
MMIIGDNIAQKLEGCEKIDAQRTLTMATYSGAVFTPLFFYLYKVADKLLRGGPVVLAAQKSIFSIVVGGIPANAVFLCIATLIEMELFGKRAAGRHASSTSAQVIREKIRDDLPRLVKGSLSFWTPINFINFYFTPIQYRVLVVSASAVVWNCYLSVVQHEYISRTGSSQGTTKVATSPRMAGTIAAMEGALRRRVTSGGG